MLLFMTEMPIAQSHSSADFLRTVGKWILDSPHTCFRKEHLAGVLEGSVPVAHLASESVEVLRVTAGDMDRAGIRYTKRNGGLEWVTTVVYFRKGVESWAGLRVSCESSHPAFRLPPVKKPVLVRTLLNDLGGASDGAMSVQGSCVRLANTDIELAARLILGRAGCRLPLVYVSAGFQGSYIVDPDLLAEKLAGMAHVVVEPNRPFSLRLKIEVASVNVYGGTVGVYWPDGGGRRSYFLGREFESPEDVAQAIFEEVRAALANRRGLDICTWASLQEAISRKVIQALQASGSQEVNKYIETFDNELAAKAELLKTAEREITRLRTELQIYEARLTSNAGALLQMGTEEDLYPNEVLGIVRDAMEDAKERVPADSRRQHVISSLLEANPRKGDAGLMRERLKELLRGSKGMDSKMRRGLEELGFSITADGKHFKLVFRGDDRYTFTLAKSGGDHRGGLNAASDIGKLLF